MTDSADDVPVPALLRAARGAYQHAIGHALADAGGPGLPRGGVLIVAALANRGIQPETVIGQVARGDRAQTLLSELSDLGYMERAADEWQATEQGRRAGAAVASAITDVDAQLVARIGPDGVAGLRRALVALCDIRDAHDEGD